MGQQESNTSYVTEVDLTTQTIIYLSGPLHAIVILANVCKISGDVWGFFWLKQKINNIAKWLNM